MKYKREIVIGLSDTHGGSKSGLINPNMLFTEYDIKTGDEIFVEPLLTPKNNYLWEQYSKHIGEVYKLIGKDPYHVFHLGDPTEGNKYGGGDLYQDPGNQILVALGNKEPFLKRKHKPKSMRFIWGTDSHEFGGGSAPILLRDLIKGKYPSIDIKSYAHGKVNVGGIWIDAAHHGSGAGIREWTRGNVFRLDTRSILKDAYNNKKPLPDLVLRAHFHQNIQTAQTEFFQDIPHTVHGILIPSYQLMNGYVRKITRSRDVTVVGMIAIEIINKRIHQIYWFIESRENTVTEVIR